MTLTVQSQPVTFEVDSGAACTLVSSDTFRGVWPTNPPVLQPSDIRLRTWAGQKIEVLGTATVDVSHSRETCQLPLLLDQGAGCNLLGRNWFGPLGIHVSGIHQTTHDGNITQLLQKFQSVFFEAISGHVGAPVQLELRDEARPKFLKARPVPFALRSPSKRRLTDWNTKASWSLHNILTGPRRWCW